MKISQKLESYAKAKVIKDAEFWSLWKMGAIKIVKDLGTEAKIKIPKDIIDCSGDKLSLLLEKGYLEKIPSINIDSELEEKELERLIAEEALELKLKEEAKKIKNKK